MSTAIPATSILASTLIEWALDVLVQASGAGLLKGLADPRSEPARTSPPGLRPCLAFSGTPSALPTLGLVATVKIEAELLLAPGLELLLPPVASVGTRSARPASEAWPSRASRR